MKRFLFLLAGIFVLFADVKIFAQEFRVVVAPFENKSDFSERDVENIQYLFSDELAKTKSITVLDQRNAMFKEVEKLMKFQEEDWSSPELVADFGLALNANAVVLGRIMTTADGKHFISVRINNLKTEIQAVGNMEVKNPSEAVGKLPAFTKGVVDGLPKPPAPPSPPAPPPPKPPKPPKKPFQIPAVFKDENRLWSIGFNLGSSLATPLFIVNMNITIPPTPYTFIEIGADYGLAHGKAGDLEIKDVKYHSWYYYGRFNGFIPFDETGGGYLGLGGGFMDAHYTFPSAEASMQTPVFDAALGIFFGSKNNLCRIGYALRTNFSGVNSRIMLGYTLRICKL